MNFYPILLHAIACIWYIFFWINFLSVYTHTEKRDPVFQDILDMGERYITNWNLFMQSLFFVGCLFHDVMKIYNGPNWLNLGSKFQMLLSLSFSSILLPTGIFVCATYWTLFAIDREIVYPKIIDTYIPFWQNHGMHTIILPLILLELFTTKHKFPPVSISILIVAGFGLLYGTVFVETYIEKGHWVYPLFGLYSLPVSMALVVFLYFTLIWWLFVGIFIQNLYWGKKEEKNGTENQLRNQVC